MSDDEKKFKLDELPDQGSEPDKIIHPAPPKKPLEKRIKDLKKMNNAEREESLSQKWHFDKPKKNWGWLYVLLLLVCIEKRSWFTGVTDLPKEREGVTEAQAVALAFIDVLGLNFLSTHPLFLAVLIPVFFKYSSSEGLFFELNFSGINTVENVDFDLKHGPKRILIRWPDITQIKKIVVNKRDVLEVHDSTGPRAHMIWDIDQVHKIVIKKVLKGLVSDKHPLRLFIEKEVA